MQFLLGWGGGGGAGAGGGGGGGGRGGGGGNGFLLANIKSELNYCICKILLSCMNVSSMENICTDV